MKSVSGIVVIIQARMSSSRLPGKVLAEIAGRPMLQHVVHRARKAGVGERVVVATSDDPSDDPVAAFCAASEITVERGSRDDVLERYYGAATNQAARAVVRLTADCPMLDPQVIDAVCGEFDPARLDYVSNTLDRTYPRGLDTEVFTFEALERARNEARLRSEREHVTPYIWKHPERFRLGQVQQQQDHASERWTVDHAQDLEFVRAVYDALGTVDFGQDEALELLRERPELRRINQGIDGNEGYLKSLEQDRVD